MFIVQEPQTPLRQEWRKVRVGRARFYFDEGVGRTDHGTGLVEMGSHRRLIWLKFGLDRVGRELLSLSSTDFQSEVASPWVSRVILGQHGLSPLTNPAHAPKPQDSNRHEHPISSPYTLSDPQRLSIETSGSPRLDLRTSANLDPLATLQARRAREATAECDVDNLPAN
jgi:hypothetical protein